MKKSFLIFLMVFFVVLISAYAAVNELNNFRYAYFDSNGNFITTNTPINQVNYVGYVCTSSNCRTVTTAAGTMFDGVARNAGAQTDNYVFTYPTYLINSNGYGIYLYKPGYITYEIKSNWAGTGTVGPYNNYLSKVQVCRAPIEQLSVLNTVQPNVPLVISINASLDATVFSAISNAGPLEYIPPALLSDYYSVQTRVTLTIYNHTNGIVFQQNKTINIPFSSAKKINFTWTPIVPGNYLARAVTDVVDTKCMASQQENAEKNFHVLSDNPRNMCYTILNSLGISNQFPNAGNNLTIYAYKISNYADDNYLLTPIPTNTTLKVVRNDGVVVLSQNKLIAANNNPVNTKYFDYIWQIPTNGEGNYTITIYGIANSPLCNGLPNLAENISIGTTVNPKPNGAPFLNDIPDKHINEDTLPPLNWIDLWAYAEDNETADQDLNFYMVSESNTALIDCRIDNNRYINCNAPAQNQFGSSVITVEVSDGLLNDRDSFTIFVDSVNDAPVLYPIGNKIVYETKLLQFQINATDIDGNILIYYASGLPMGATFNPTTRRFSWTPNVNQSGAYFVIFNVSDGLLYDWERIKITVLNSCVDADADGYYKINVSCQGSDDCDDNNALIHPGAVEVCNGKDDNCDTIMDNGGNALCNDGLYCNGAEICNGLSGCISGIPINCNDNIGCTEDSCNENTDSCNHLANNTKCNNGLYCDGIEICNVLLGCQAGTAIDCSGNNIPFIATCNNNPDNNPFTWDSRNAFTSTCNEATDSCNTGSLTITHTCSVTQCQAQCDATHSCTATDCDWKDGCQGNDYYDYSDVANTCLAGCTCTNNQCRAPTISYNDPRCTQCQTDNDCNYLDTICADGVCNLENYKCEQQFKPATTVCKASAGVCDLAAKCTGSSASCPTDAFRPNTYECRASAGVCDIADKCTGSSANCPTDAKSTAQCRAAAGICDLAESCDGVNNNCPADAFKSSTNVCKASAGVCDLEEKCTGSSASCPTDAKAPLSTPCNDGLWCTATDHCDGNGNCVQLTARDCSSNNIAGVATCDNNPDNIHFTWDSRNAFTSTCNEATDSCNTGSLTITHTCSVTQCQAQCDATHSCTATDCDWKDGCQGNDYYDYSDVANTCLVGCTCTNNQCGAPTISYNDPRCTECQDDDDCNDLDDDYCDGNIVMHTEGICVNHNCEVDTLLVDDCNVRDGIMNDCGLIDWACSEEINQVHCVIIDIEAEDALCPPYCEGDILNEGNCGATTYQCNYIQQDCNSLNNNYCDSNLLKHDDYTCGLVNSSGWIPPPPNDFDCVLDDTVILEECVYGCFDNSCIQCTDNDQDGFNVEGGFCGLVDCDDTNSVVYPSATEICDGLDNDCDSLIDEDFTNLGNSCSVGLGECQSCGYYVCSIDGSTTECDAVAGQPSDEICDGLDNDCDGSIDEGLGQTTCGLGICEHIVDNCIGGEEQTCDPYEGATNEICDNGLDDDCDGLTDLDDDDCFECTTDDDCNNLDDDYCEGDLVKHDEGRCVDYACETQTTTVQDCNDNLFCNGIEACNNAQCVAGTAVDCSANNICGIATCSNNPDSNPFTWDYRQAFTSECNEQEDECTTGSSIITHTCSVAQCQAECDATHSCAVTDCDYLDGCYGNDYYDYNDVANSCLAGCTCTDNQCGAPSISYNDPRCTECQDDDDCNDLDDDYCDGSQIMHDEGTCLENVCVSETTMVYDCDNGLYCDGEETCNNANCVAGTQVDCSDSEFCTVNEGCDESSDSCVYDTRDCSANNVFGVASCYNNPDNNPSTWDYRQAFTSTCNEQEDECTTGSTMITHECNIAECEAECEDNDDCDDIDCDYMDGCQGNDYYDYDDVPNSCLDCCECTENQCGQPTISYNDGRCIECVDNDGDGYYAISQNCPDSDDCDDNDDTIYLGADDSECNGVDNDCDILIDEDYIETQTSCGIGVCAANGLLQCINGNEVDSCITGTPEAEICDGLDNDCDGSIDEGLGQTTCGLGICEHIVDNCIGGEEQTCDPYEGATNEICDNGLDDDCDGSVDEGCLICTDHDGDGYSVEGGDCGPIDCDDNDGITHPGAPELCDGKDNNCNGVLGIGEVDNDGDGYMVCEGDCDDNDASVNPGAIEILDGKDNDCDGKIDEDLIKLLIDKLPRKKFLISQIRVNQLVYDEVKPGGLLFVDLTFENIGREDTKYATIRITQPELGISKKLGPFRGPEVDEVMSRGLYLEIPEDAEPGVYTVRISLSDLNGLRRTRHRDFRVTE